MTTKDTIIAGFFILLFGMLGFFWFSPSGIKQAPDINLTLIDGNTLKLAGLRGKPVLVTFWATTCPTCLKEIPHLIELHKEFSNLGLTIIGIAMYYDPPHHVVAMAKQRPIPYRVAIDIDKTAMHAFRIRELTPNSFLIAPDGRVVYHKVGEMDMNKVRGMIEKFL